MRLCSECDNLHQLKDRFLNGIKIKLKLVKPKLRGYKTPELWTGSVAQL